MESKTRWSLAYAACAALFSAFAYSQVSLDKFAQAQWRLCPEAILERPIEVPIEWVPVGCETVDCCPGCPGPLAELEWRIRVEGAPLESVIVDFQNLPQQNALKVRSAALEKEGPIVVGRGETVIKGLPYPSKNDEEAPVAKLELQFDKSWLEKRVAAAKDLKDAPDKEDDLGDGSITIEQWHGKYLVNEFQVAYRIPLCWWPPLQDRIVLSSNASLDNTSVYLDGRRAIGCINDEKRRGTGTIGLGNVLAKGACRAETVVFSDDDAMRLVENVGVWTNLVPDTQPIGLTPNLLKAPVTVWNVRPGFLSFLTPLLDLLNANVLYNSNNSGIGFLTSDIRNVSGNAAAVATIGTGCANAPLVLGSAFFVPNRLNVYYVNSAFTGVNCNASRNIQYVGTTSNNQTLAHEFGHSMSLDHTNGLAGFAANNVMVGGGQNRTHFSDGQSFRMNAHCSSTLNANGTRAGPVRRCNSTISGPVSCPGADSHCLPVETDQLPK